MSVLWHKIQRDISRRRIRSALTILGIVIGVSGLVAISVTGRQLANAQRALTIAPNHPELAVRTVPISDRITSLIARQPGVARVDSRTVADAEFTVGGPWRSCFLIGGTNLQPDGLARPELIAGRFPGRGEIAFDADVADLAKVKIGDLVAVRLESSQADSYFRVVGFTRTPAAIDAGILNQVTAYTSAADVAHLLGQTGANELLVKLRPGEDSHLAASQLGRLLDSRGIGRGPIAGPDTVLVGARELHTLVWLLFAFSGLGLVLSGFLVANTAAATVQDELGQIGILKALGGRHRHILLTYLTPALILGCSGTVIGYVAGIGGGYRIILYLTGLLGYPVPSGWIAWREIGLALLVGLGLPVAASLGPALLGARVPVVALLRHYGIAQPTGRQRIRGFFGLIGRHWPLLAMAGRNTLRRRWRAIITISLIAVAVAAAIASQALSSSLNRTVATLYDLYGADAWISFDPVADAPLAASIAHQPGVAAAEPWARVTGFARGQSIDLWGVPASTTIYHARVTSGRWLETSDSWGAVASDSLARHLSLTVGDQVALDIGSQTRDLTIVGIVNDESTYLGSTDAGKLFLLPTTMLDISPNDIYTFVAARFFQHDPASVDATLDTLQATYAPLHPAPHATYTDKAGTAQTINVLVVLLRVMVVLIGAIGAVGVINTLAMNIAERRREIGSLRALGARRRHISTLLLGEGAVLGGYGFALGVAIGYPLSRILVASMGNLLFRLSFHLPATYLAAVCLATLAICGLASVGPALIAARVRPAVVLRYE